MFRLFFVFAVALACAKDWTHYTGQNEIRDVILADNGALWAAFAWGLQERLASKTENTYMPGNNNLAVADFVQLFALPGGDIIAASKNGSLVRKNKNSKLFETISNSFIEKKRNVLQGLGKRAENILILPFEGALAFYDYERNYSVITLSKIGTSSLDEIKRIAVEGDSLWVELNGAVWKRKIDWDKISEDRFLQDPKHWIEVKDKKIPFAEKPKPKYETTGLNNFNLQRVRTISSCENNVIAWGVDNDTDYFVRIRNGKLGQRFVANPSDYPGTQLDPPPSALASLPDGSFASGRWGSGLLVFGNGFPEEQLVHWFHSTNSNNECPTEWSNNKEGYTIVQGVAAAPDFSGYIFSYMSESNYGLGFVDKNGKANCKKSEKASSGFAHSIIARNDANGKQEIYVAWRNSLDSKDGGVDFYSGIDFYSSEFIKKWSLSFGSPIDFAFDSRGVLWAVSSAKIFYLDRETDEWKEPSYVRGFDGGVISALESDARNGLWIGTFGDGAYSFSQINNSPDSLTAKRFRIKDGLLNETINDIAIDTIKGLVYFAHDLGLSVYSTALVRNTLDYMQSGAPKPIAYPNPFRPELHNVVKIDYISENSSLYILDSSGKRVRFFKGSDLQGGMVIWDGRNESGKLVAPGLYYYFASDKKNIAKGKILVER